ncbi:MAG: hypothetical protein R3C12_21165 [Planctomycetaceae bacterium]|nr:hypothetical protein [Planctomycetaceae bacterium]
MGARQRLNSIHIHIAIAISAMIGLACQSWTVFLLSCLVLIGVGIHSGDIRPNRRR